MLEISLSDLNCVDLPHAVPQLHRDSQFDLNLLPVLPVCNAAIDGHDSGEQLSG